jgi:hypothetical protein
MADNGCRLPIAERGDEAERVAHRIQQAERRQVVVVIGAPSSGAAVAAQIRRNRVKPGGGERRHDLAPGIGDLRKAVQQQQQRPSGLAGFKDMNAQPVDPLDKARADAGGKNSEVERRQIGHAGLQGKRSQQG